MPHIFMWYLYCHTNQINGKRYIGITGRKPARRWKGGSGYKKQPLFYNAIKKYGWNAFSHDILFSNLTKEEAGEKEIFFIALFRSADKRYGYNNTRGGLGGSFEKKPTTIAKLQNNRFCRPVLKIDKETGEPIERFSSLSSAARAVGDTSMNIHACCSKKQRQMSAKGFCWAFEDEYDASKFRKPSTCKKQVAQIDVLTGNIVAIYESARAAADAVSANPSNISKCCNGVTKTCKGFAWKYNAKCQVPNNS